MRGRWTDEEHNLFLEALIKYGKDWDKIESHIKSRDAAHIRSHAQKFFTKLVKFLAGNKSQEYIDKAEVYLEILQRKVLKVNRRKKKYEMNNFPKILEKIFKTEKVDKNAINEIEL